MDDHELSNAVIDYVKKSNSAKDVEDYVNILTFDDHCRLRSDVWFAISGVYGLSNAFMRKFRVKLNPHELAAYQNPSDELLDEFPKLFNWTILSGRKEIITDAFLMKFRKHVDWGRVLSSRQLNESFITQMADYINWRAVIVHQDLSERFVENNYNFFRYIGITHCIADFCKFSDGFYERTGCENNTAVVVQYGSHKLIKYKTRSKMIWYTKIDKYINPKFIDDNLKQSGISGDEFDDVKKIILEMV